jgi:hypothetical protein
VSDLLEYAAWKLEQAKTLLHMPDGEIAKMTGASRPTVQAWKDNPGRMPVSALAILEDHLAFVAAALPITQLNDERKLHAN